MLKKGMEDFHEDFLNDEFISTYQRLRAVSYATLHDNGVMGSVRQTEDEVPG